MSMVSERHMFKERPVHAHVYINIQFVYTNSTVLVKIPPFNLNKRT